MSTLTWIDHSERQRPQILDAVDLFHEKDTRDGLGIAGIRDAFSDMLFPGTGAVQTGVLYFLFVPWMYLGFEVAHVSSANIYCNGLKLLRICQFTGSQAQYHRCLDRQATAGAAVR